MNVKKFLIFFLGLVASFSVFSLGASAAPILFNPIPENNSYVSGGERTFSIEIKEENLNTSTVMLNIIEKSAYEKGEPWDVYLMTCTNSTPSDWVCTKTISLAIVGSDTVEYFYFTANDTFGNSGFNGTKENPLRFTLDRNPPEITFINPKNESWVSGVLNITLDVKDVSSGVNDSSVFYSFDNSSWFSTTKNIYYKAKWNTSTVENNQTVTIYAKASDKIGNTGYKRINVTVDNEFPLISVIQPLENQTVSGIIGLKIIVKDVYSGINNLTVSYSVDGFVRGMSCSGTIFDYTCDSYFDTKLVSDGFRTINFSSSDNAGNTNSTSLLINVDNKILSVSIIHPTNNAYIRGVTWVNATVSDPTKFQGAKLKIGETWYVMGCSNGRCYYSWNTSKFAEGVYNLFVNVTSNLDYLVNSSISVTVDNTKPNITIDSPVEEKVNGTIYPRVIVTDTYGVNPEKIIFNISSYSSGMSCSKFVEGKKYVCGGNFNTTLLADGYYVLYFYAEDLAGNSNSINKTLYVENGVSGLQQTTEIQQTTTTLPTQTQPRNESIPQIGGIIEAVSNFFKSIEFSDVFLPMISVLTIFIFITLGFRLFPKKFIVIKKEIFNVENFFNQEQTALHFVYNYLLAITSGTSTDTKGYLRSALAFIKRMEKVSIREKMEKSLGELKDKKGFIKEFDETYSKDRNARENYIERIHGLLLDALKEKDEEKIKEIVKEAQEVCANFLTFSKNEFSLYKKFEKILRREK